MVVNFSSAPWIQQSKEVCDYRLWLQSLVVKCHNKGSCIQGPVKKLSWLHTNFITKQRLYLIQCYNDQSQFSFLCRNIWEIFNNHFRLLLQREAGYFDNDHVACLSTLIY